MEGDPPEEEELEGTPEDMELAFQVFTQMQATDWRFLPAPGGLLDQPELLMNNLFILAGKYQELKNPNV